MQSHDPAWYSFLIVQSELQHPQQMNSQHPIRKKQEPVPHDPRNEPLPESDKEGRSQERTEKKVRNDLDLKGSATALPTGRANNKVPKENVETEDEYGLPTGIPIGQTAHGLTGPNSRDQRAAYPEL